MAVAWQTNLATTTSNLENYNNNSNKKKNCITQDTRTYKNIKKQQFKLMPKGEREGGGGGDPKLRNAGFPL